MKTLLPWFAFIFIAYVFQSSVFNVISYDGISVNLMLLIAVFLSILYDRYAILYGFAVGLFYDLASGSFLGLNAFSLTIICLFTSALSHRFYKENIFLPLVASIAATVCNNFITAILIFLLGYDYSIWQVINNTLIVLIYNLIFAYPVYFIVLKFDNKLQEMIKRSKQF